MIPATQLSQLPQDVRKLVRRVYMNRSVADFEKLCNRLSDCSASELCILQPVLYMYLDPDRIPAKSTPAAATDIELVYRSLLVIVATLGYIDGSGIGSAGSEKQYLISAWNRVAPWLIFFHDQFIMCRANYRPVDKMAAIRVVASLLFHVLIVSDKRSGATLLTTPALYRPIAELWLLALETKDKDVVCLSSSSGPAHITSFRVFGSFSVSSCIQDESFVPILLEVSGGIDAVTSAALKYLKSLRSMAKDPDIASNAVKLKLLIPMFSHCIRIIATTSMLDAAIREAYVLRQSVKEIFWALHVLQSLPLGKESMPQALAPSFTYLDFLLKRADDPVSALHQALCARAFETMVHISPSGPLPVEMKVVETDPRRINEAFFWILFKYILHDKILSYVCKHVDAWSNDLGPVVRQEKHLLDIWSHIEQTIRAYGALRFKAETICWPSPSEKGWVLQCHCGGTAEDIRFRQCAGCQVVRYCSKRCQRDSWHSHHRLSCNFLKAAVGSSTPHRMKRSLRLLAAVEVAHKQRKWDNILRLVAAAQCKYPEDQERLVVELALDKRQESVRPLRDYLFLFNGLSENEVVDRLSSWPDTRGQLEGLQGPFLCSVITIHDRYWSRQILFSPCMALDMEIYGDSATNAQP
ncbi:uncharacterized protein F5147DRAFT_263433 [Suillus discolor]|uniref:MYND-type domain-containing protein n=1 Tax=Suillus discolor TaxID=1912936 RepID=A0A9P7F323_9AGAM|nr:uncharacterized protein F5147DRAFT_263433 [Suillus discolor]KAG2104736.1 hypothetical protein F5147DRAFT_263433 [Suillus discolor]